MSPEVLSILGLCVMFVIATILPVNMGVLAFVGAFLVGTPVAGMATKDIIAGFPGGLFLTCSCSGLLSRDEFLTLLRASARRAGRSAPILAVTGASADHPIGLEALEGEYLKAVWMIMGEARAPDEREPADDPAPALEE